jgi:hypothetical protein
MDLAAIQIQALVRQAQNEYVIAFATKIGRSLIGPSEKMETCKYFNEHKNISSISNLATTTVSNLHGFPSFTPFQPTKRVCKEYFHLSNNNKYIIRDVVKMKNNQQQQVIYILNKSIY